MAESRRKIPRRRSEAPSEEGAITTKDQVRNLLGIIADDEDLQNQFRRVVGASGVVGRPKKRRKKKKAGDEHARKFSALVGDATHGEDFLPVPPDPVVQKAKEMEKEQEGMGDQLMDRYYDRWEEGQLVSDTGLSSDDLSDVEEMMENAKAGILVG